MNLNPVAVDPQPAAAGVSATAFTINRSEQTSRECLLHRNNRDSLRPGFCVVLGAAGNPPRGEFVSLLSWRC